MSQFAYWLVGFFVIYGAQAMGWGFTGLLLVIAAYAIAYAWRHFRQQRAESAPRRPS
jgi:hypothetical protein